MKHVRLIPKPLYPFVNIALAGLIAIGAILATTEVKKNIVVAEIAKPIIDIESPVPLAPTPAVQQNSPFSLAANLKVPILMYHYIRDYQNPKDRVGQNLSVSRATFAKQLADIKQAGYTTITFNDLYQPLPEKPIILTFDDGYDDAYGDALPSLQKEGMKGVFYLVSSFLNKPGYLTTDQVKLLDAAGMSIGAHTVDHRDLSRISYPQQQTELTESKTVLEGIIGKPVLDVCYPSGKYNSLTIKLSQAIGYRTATTTHPGVALGQDFNTRPFELKRIRVQNDTDILKEIGQ